MDKTAVDRAVKEWKVAYGFAVEGNYTFHLPLTEVWARWEKARAAEQSLTRVLCKLSSLIKSKTMLHIIEADIHALENEINACKASSTPENTIATHLLEVRVKEAYALAADVARLSKVEGS